MKLIIYFFLLISLNFSVLAQNEKIALATARSEKVTTVLKTFLALGSDSVPFQVFKKSKGVAVFNDVTLLNLMLSKATKGKGLLSLRNGDDWSIPTFADFGSSGFELKIADKKKFDIVCFIMSQYLVETIKNGKIKPDDLNSKKLALGPVVSGVGADLVIDDASLIYYTFQDGKISGLEFQSDGFFSAVVIGHDNNLNQAIYQKKAQKIFAENPTNLTILPAVNNFRQTIIDGLKPIQ